MTEPLFAGSSPWLASLIGDAWAPQLPKPASDLIQTLARRGLVDPAA